MGTLPFPVFLGKILSALVSHGMTQSQAHPSAGSALDGQAGCQCGSGRSWSWERSRAHSTEPQNPFLHFPLAHCHPWGGCLTSPQRVREIGLQVRHSKPSARMVQREKEKCRMDGWSPVFPPERCLSSCRWPLGSKAHQSTRAGCIPQQPSCGHPSLSSDSLDAPPGLQALCSWLPASFYRRYAVSFTSLYTCLLHKIVNMHVY